VIFSLWSLYRDDTDDVKSTLIKSAFARDSTLTLGDFGNTGSDIADKGLLAPYRKFLTFGGGWRNNRLTIISDANETIVSDRLNVWTGKCLKSDNYYVPESLLGSWRARLWTVRSKARRETKREGRERETTVVVIFDVWPGWGNIPSSFRIISISLIRTLSTWTDALSRRAATRIDPRRDRAARPVEFGNSGKGYKFFPLKIEISYRPSNYKPGIPITALTSLLQATIAINSPSLYPTTHPRRLWETTWTTSSYRHRITDRNKIDDCKLPEQITIDTRDKPWSDKEGDTVAH